jgi:hypothetical protein
MVFDNAYFTNIPWETAIKVYKSFVGNGSFDTLQEYADDFLKFLITDERLYDSGYEKELVESVLDYCLSQNGIEYKSRQEQTLSDKIEKSIKNFSEEKFLDGFDENFIKLFLEKHKQHLLVYMNDIVNTTIDNKTRENIILLCAYTISKSNYFKKYKISSGIVIAGYGNKDLFPSLNEYKIVGIICGKLIYELKNRINIYDPSSSPAYISSLIIPFAQTEIVETYTLGIAPEISNTIFNKINTIFNNFYEVIQSNFYEVIQTEYKNDLEHEFSCKDIDIINKVGKKLKNQIEEAFLSVQKEKYSTPFFIMVDFLGKEEMASFAEALVNLTSTRRRFTTDEETVGGATDVAVITKGEGFRWIKRKEFFKTELNIS